MSIFSWLNKEVAVTAAKRSAYLLFKELPSVKETFQAFLIRP
ncbi:hypothetical protein [Porticoccus hydrocarbonoclasticus]|tara:strand:+ start:3215 stop:3340 length:126 start_codon:yes stop_codon:yes gene_type:complete